MLHRQRDESAFLRLDDEPQPFRFFRRPNRHNQVDVALAQSPEERMTYVEGVSPRFI